MTIWENPAKLAVGNIPKEEGEEEDCVFSVANPNG